MDRVEALEKAIEMRWGLQYLGYTRMKADELQEEERRNEEVSDKQDIRESALSESRAVDDRHKLRALCRDLIVMADELDTFADPDVRAVSVNLRRLANGG